MDPVWLLLLLPSLLKAQVTPDFTPGVTVEADNSTGTSDVSPSSSLRPPEPSAFAVTPSEAPPVEEDDWSPAETFLYTGEPYTLDVARCSRAYSPPGQTGSLPLSFSAPLRPALDALANTANFLNMIFQASDLRESTVQEDMEWYHAMVRALLEADLLIRRALFTFDADPTSLVPQLVLCASRNPMAKVQTIILEDLSKAWDSLHPPAPAPDDSWFRSFKFPEPNKPMAALSKRVLLNDLSTLDTPKWRQGDSYVTNHSGVRWDSAPFLDCKDGLFVPDWMLTLSTSFYGLKPDLTPEFRGVIRVDVNIQDIDLDQCATGDGWFADTHQCNRTTMECVPTPGRGFRLGQYCCRCKEGYYDPETDSGVDADGGRVNGSDGGGGVCYPNMPICLPCWPGCTSCQDGTPCWVQEAWFLRAGVLGVQGVFMLLIFVSMLVAYRHRRNRRIRASGLLLLETILFGSLLLYFPVFIMYFKPSTFRCILLRWVRMLGFSIVYGTVTLKMYRVLKVFLSRTAQRVPYLSSLYLLRILGVMLMTVSWFLCAWTVGVLQNRDRNIPVFVTTNTSDGQGFNLCYMDRWDYMMAVAELLFLCWGSSLWTTVRPVPSAFHEPRYMGIAIHNELLLSSMFHLFRFTFSSLHPDWMLLLSFTHTHVTITVTLALLFIPKFLYVSKPGREEIAAEVYEDEVDLRRSGSYLNSSFHSAWSEHSGVDPDDFRDELKKLYAQLEVHKTKKMTANNPHLSKKRSSRCALGRSIIRRIAEIPESMSRQCSRDDKDGSFHNRFSVNQSESYRRAPDTVSISYKSSMKSPSPSPLPSPSMRKSQSDHHYVRERDPSLRDSMLKANTVKRSSRRSETDSLDIPPGVCKSASAQNLTIDTNLLHPDHTRLHKSWSLTSTTTNSMENISKVNRASTVMTRSRQSISISEQTRSALQSESFDKTDVCPWDVEQEQSGDKNQKHVTYANAEDGEDQGPSSPKRLVCPWDHLPPVEKKPSEDKEKGATESPKPKSQVSASAPGTPRPKVTKDQRVFSFRTTTSKWLSVKSTMESFDAGSRSSIEGKSNKDDSVSQKSQESASTTPRLGTSSRRPNMEKRSLQKRSMTTAEKPCLVKQNAVRRSSGDSFDRSPRRLSIGKTAVYPWDTDDMQKDGTYENVFLSRQNSKRSSTSSWETASGCRTPSAHRRGSNRITPVRNISYADMCPWDGAGNSQEGEGLKKQQSIKVDVCPWESEPSNVCPWETQEQGNVRRQSGRGEACPWESQDIPVICYTNTSKDLQTQQSLKRPADACPWETAESPRPSMRQEHEYVTVCPWDVQDKAEVVYENLNTLETKRMLSVPLEQEHMKPAVYPGASTESLSNEQQHLAKSPALHFGRQVTKAAESCPWNFPDPPENMGDLCPWEQGNTEPTNTGLTTKLTVKVDICPWETGHQDKTEDLKNCVSPLRAASVQTDEKDDTSVNICPWETDPPKTTAAIKMLSQGQERSADVCPWDSGKPDSDKTQSPKTSESHVRQDTVCANICPWDTEESGEVKTQVSKTSEEPQRNSQENVCPWDTEAPKLLKKQDSNQAGVCPWDTDRTKVLQKQDSTRADVCPWDTNEPKPLKKQDSDRAGVCPWETEEPKVLQKQDSTQADVCPWDTDEPKVLQKQESVQADVCPWDTDRPKVLEKQESVQADVCPWDTDETKVLQKQDSTQADVCPWDTDEPKVLKKQESVRPDVCPWDTKEPGVVKKQDSPGGDVCPWESKEPQTSTESKVDVTQSDQDEVTENQGPFSVEETPEDIGTEQIDERNENLALGRRDALCPWGMVRSRSGSFTDNTSDVFTWEPENIPEEDEDDDAEFAAEALVFPPDL
ncbi:LOW QUALITY PROTEIN: probable G-protein coupled receptor 158 [Cottoperca gobio]|uniref:LOW QUALITY PROTEIN: probable G-protein coupled receptor 158 n=1 Tax=Cottoperca gobio TaxID=56716 RepID=A0A6J2PF18_COTGO|nr:LOW QUALITY PROTEIN: probable G-protein coupled receptor 158 [Cottoperca gobio]